MGRITTRSPRAGQAWLGRHGMFAVATALLAMDRYLKCSPKCGDSFRVLAPRDVLDNYSDKVGPLGLAEYLAKKNRVSIDGLPGLRGA